MGFAGFFISVDAVPGEVKNSSISPCTSAAVFQVAEYLTVHGAIPKVRVRSLLNVS